MRAFKKLKGKKERKKKKHARWQLHPYPHPTPFSGGYHFLHAGSGAWRNESCQILAQSVKGLRPGGRKSPFSIDPYNSVRTNVLHCDNCMCLSLHVLLYAVQFMLIFLYHGQWAVTWNTKKLVIMVAHSSIVRAWWPLYFTYVSYFFSTHFLRCRKTDIPETFPNVVA